MDRWQFSASLKQHRFAHNSLEAEMRSSTQLPKLAIPGSDVHLN
jgi:hypothetical protein